MKKATHEAVDRLEKVMFVTVLSGAIFGLLCVTTLILPILGLGNGWKVAGTFGAGGLQPLGRCFFSGLFSGVDSTENPRTGSVILAGT